MEIGGSFDLKAGGMGLGHCDIFGWYLYEANLVVLG